MNAANRGKYGEDKVKDYLTQLAAERAGFCFNRILDAHSAKGAMSNPQPGDFQWFVDMGMVAMVENEDSSFTQVNYTRNGLIEVKTTEHAFRLPYNSFGTDQVSRMVIRQLAGSECYVLICHHKSGERGALFRHVPLEFFKERPGTKFGSWDLNEFPLFNSVKEAMEEYLS